MTTQQPYARHPKHPDGPGDGNPEPNDAATDYRQLERRYRESAQYAAMVERYPLLRLSIASSQQEGLIGGQRVAQHLPPAVQLEWNRSHGET